jgi:16S rRNA A1518/A1519 N6-dimethyltransferase RsmA/KsgA/DIM1 with predicted DNA glycosylase/AP lyase activity
MTIAKIIFSNKRKKLLKTIEKNLKLKKESLEEIKQHTKINDYTRPEELEIKDLRTLSFICFKNSDSPISL